MTRARFLPRLKPWAPSSQFSWYRTASTQEEPPTPEESAARVAVEFWEKHAEDAMPRSGRGADFAKRVTDAILMSLAGEPFLDKNATGGAFENRREQLEAYALLLFRELSWRYAALFSSARAEGGGAKERADVLRMVHDEIKEASGDLIRSVQSPTR